MPGVIMDNGDRNGSHTNHDRDQRPNGVNGGSFVPEKGQDKGKGREPLQNMTPTSPTGPNVLNGLTDPQPPARERAVIPADLQARMGQLPPEIEHITQNYLPLATLLTRFAQKSHSDLAAKILELAQMPVSASAVNGNVSHTPMDDNSSENVNKKYRLLEFAQNAHADWTKAFVITSWSRNSDDVSKLIDLRHHLNQKGWLYWQAFHAMADMKKELASARIPNPDLRTALQVLSTGEAPWMPEFHYIEPPPLTAKDLMKTVEHLNTLLTIRMNLHEYDNLPWQFKDYIIKSGRVTFRVAGEFEVDLGIADEDPGSQFWFIDFRFLFSPSLPEFPAVARAEIESRVNVVLKDGFLGCYNLLHEMVLTHKISEFRRQAFDLSRGLWIDALKPELLNRSLSIQYWVDRYGKEGPKSWMILGVHSGRRKDGRPSPKATSRLSIRWFRNAKEVRDVDIPFDTVNISVLSLLKTVIAQHVKYILTSIYEKLQNNPIFAKHEAGLSLSTSPDEPSESALKVQLTNTEHLTVRIEPITGRFIFSPASPMIGRVEYMLNKQSRDPTLDAHAFVENLRALVIMEDFSSHGLSAGWMRDPGPKISPEDFKSKLKLKNFLQHTYFRRASWLPNWYAVLTLGMDGERWFLLEVVNTPSGPTISVSIEMQITGVSPSPTYTFFSRLNIYAAALISHFVNLKTLHLRHAHHTSRDNNSTSPIRVPFILMRLSELLPSKNKSPRTGKPWAKDSVKLTFQGLEPATPEEYIPTSHQLSPPQASLSKAKAKAIGSNSPAATPQMPAAQPPPIEVPRQFGAGEGVVIVTEARMSVPVPQALTILKERVERDIAFDAKTGTFAFRLRSKVGETVIPAFVERAIRVERLVDFVEVLHKHEKALKCEYISLGRIIFTYGTADSADAIDLNSSKGYKSTVDFGSTDSMMTLEFEKGNPHLRIADSLTKVLNERQGLDGVATLLPLTLPALRALDTLEGEWAALAGNEVMVFVRAVEWFVIRYDIKPPNQPKPRKIVFEIRLQQRKGEPWWYVRRTDTRDREGDDVDAVLKPVWNSAGRGWRGMRVSGVAQPVGMEDLIGKLDEVMRSFASGNNNPEPVPAPAPAPAQIKPPQRAPEAPMMAQRQQPTPNQSQSQNQGRNTPNQSQGRSTLNQSQGRNTPNQSQGQNQGRSNTIKREFVEID